MAAILFALRMNPSANQRSPFEQHLKSAPNTITELVSNRAKVVSAAKSPVQLALSNIESGQDVAVLVRERTRNTKLGLAFAKKQGQMLSSSPHTISFLPSGLPDGWFDSRQFLP